MRQAAAPLGKAHPFRQAAALLGRMIGCFVDHRRLWGWAQRSGREVRKEHERKRAALFELGEAPPERAAAPGIVSTSADGTFIHSRDGPIEVKLGMWWTGAHLLSPTARHRKWLLQGKGFYASTHDAETFGQTFYALAEEATGLSRAREVLLVADGAGWLADLSADRIAPTAYQLDHLHGRLRIRAT